MVDAPGNDGNASMPEHVNRPNPWIMVMMMMIRIRQGKVSKLSSLHLSLLFHDILCNTYSPIIFPFFLIQLSLGCTFEWRATCTVHYFLGDLIILGKCGGEYNFCSFLSRFALHSVSLSLSGKSKCFPPRAPFWESYLHIFVDYAIIIRTMEVRFDVKRVPHVEKHLIVVSFPFLRGSQ